MADNFMDSIQATLDAPDATSETTVVNETPTTTTATETSVTPTVDTPKVDFMSSIQGTLDTDTQTQQTQEQKPGQLKTQQPTQKESHNSFIMSKANQLGLKPMDMKTGGAEFKKALQGDNNEDVGFWKNLARGGDPEFWRTQAEQMEKAFSGETIGEGVANELLRNWGKLDNINEERFDLATKLLEKNPEKEELIRKEMSKPKIDVSNPDIWKLAGDSAEAAIDIATLSYGKALTASGKTVLKQLGKQLEREALKSGEKGGVSAVKQFVQLLRKDLSVTGGALTKGKNVLSAIGIGGGSGASRTLAQGGSGEDALMSGVVNAALAAGLQLGVGPLMKMIGSSPAGSKMEKYLQPFLDQARRSKEMKDGLVFFTQGKNPRVKFRLPGDDIREMAPVIQKRLPGLHKQDIGTAVSDISDEISRSAREMAPRLSKVKPPAATKLNVKSSIDAAEKEFLGKDSSVGKEGMIKKSFDILRKQLQSSKFKSVQDFQDFRRMVDNSTDASTKNYDIASNTSVEKELLQTLWKKKRDILNEEAIKIADTLNDVGLGKELKELSTLFRAQDNILSISNSNQARTLWEKFGNFVTLLIGGAIGAFGAKLTK